MKISRLVGGLGLVLVGISAAHALGQVQVIGTVRTNPTSGSTTTVQGVDAHDAAVTGRPVLFGVYGSTTLPTAVTLGDVSRVLGDQFGRLVVVSGCPKNVGPTTTNATDSGDTVVISSPGANLSLYIATVMMMNRDSANVVVSLAEGSSDNIKWRGEIASEGGAGAFSSRSLWKLPENTQLAVNLGAASNVDVSVMDYCVGPSTP